MTNFDLDCNRWRSHSLIFCSFLITPHQPAARMRLRGTAQLKCDQSYLRCRAASSWMLPEATCSAILFTALRLSQTAKLPKEMPQICWLREERDLYVLHWLLSSAEICRTRPITFSSLHMAGIPYCSQYYAVTINTLGY
jgi:hypothetical protein